MLEVLIAMMILSIGLLGSASMQAIALNWSQSSHHRIQALNIAEEIVNRMKANRMYINATHQQYPLIPETYSGFNIYNDEKNWSYNNQNPVNTSQSVETCVSMLKSQTMDDFSNAFNCRARIDIAEIRQSLNPIVLNTTSVKVRDALPKESLVFVDCEDSKMLLSVIEGVTEAITDVDSCSPGSLYRIYILWLEDSPASLKQDCRTRLSSFKDNNPQQLLGDNYDCLTMVFVP